MTDKNHPHIHANSTHCMNEECGHHRENSYTHSHDNGHKAHSHPAEEGELVIDFSEKMDDEKPKDNPEDKLPPKSQNDDKSLGGIFR